MERLLLLAQTVQKRSLKLSAGKAVDEDSPSLAIVDDADGSAAVVGAETGDCTTGAICAVGGGGCGVAVRFAACRRARRGSTDIEDCYSSISKCRQRECRLNVVVKDV